MSWAFRAWHDTFGELEWYIGGSGEYLSTEVQIKHPVGAIVEGRVDILEPHCIDTDEEYWYVDIVLPGRLERWKVRKGDRHIDTTYLLDEHAGDAGKLGPYDPFNSIDDVATQACEYLREIDLHDAYQDFRHVMRLP